MSDAKAVAALRMRIVERRELNKRNLATLRGLKSIQAHLERDAAILRIKVYTTVLDDIDELLEPVVREKISDDERRVGPTDCKECGAPKAHHYTHCSFFLSDRRRFRLDVYLDYSIMTCPCGSSFQPNIHNQDAWTKWKATHRCHTADAGATYLEINDPVAWAKCCAGPCPEPTIKPLRIT